jgi:UDP-glucose 4-epimerase
MRILVTGANGNLGNYLCEELLSRGHSVRAMTHYNSHNLTRLKKDLEIVKADIRFADECFESSKDCDSIIHLAACINVDRSRFHPRLFYETNVQGTMNMLEASRINDCTMVYMSTCEVLGNIPIGKASEEYSFKQPCSPYASSKYAAESYCYAYYSTYGLQVNVARGFNLCGPRQKRGSKGAVIPIFVNQILSGNPPIIFGDGKQTRDYVDVRDNVKGLSLLAESNFKGELFHLCSGKETSVNEISSTIIGQLGSKLKPIYRDARPGELRRSVGDNAKIKSLLDWEPTISFDSMVSDVINYQKSQLS